MDKKIVIKLIVLIIFQAFVVMDFVWAGGAVLKSNYNNTRIGTLAPKVQISQSQFQEICLKFRSQKRSIKEVKVLPDEIRKTILIMLNKAGSGHTGGSLSCVEPMLGVYSYMKHDPKNPKWEGRDWFILSKGHACPTQYAILAHFGYFDREVLWTLRQIGSILQGHPSILTPGVEVGTGSLGQGLSIANGIALGLKSDKKKNRVYVLLGDGELQEGQVWEAAMTASHYKLDNVCAIIDRNHWQIDGRTEDIVALEPLKDKWRSFGWYVIEIDGHNIPEILSALGKAERIKGQPTVIIAHTIKGKGVSFMENNNEYHGRAPTDEELERAIREINERQLKLQEEEISSQFSELKELLNKYNINFIPTDTGYGIEKILYEFEAEKVISIIGGVIRINVNIEQRERELIMIHEILELSKIIQTIERFPGITKSKIETLLKIKYFHWLALKEEVLYYDKIGLSPEVVNSRKEELKEFDAGFLPYISKVEEILSRLELKKDRIPTDEIKLVEQAI